jgi:hypothetical protein
MRPGSKRLLLAAAAVVGAAIILYGLVTVVLYTRQPSVRGDEVLQAVQRFAAAHRPLPATVTFSQLIAEGCLRPDALNDFGATEVTIHLHPDPRSPQMVWMDALMPDGSHATLLGDGSVQGFSGTGFQATAPTNAPAATFGAGGNGSAGKVHR